MQVVREATANDSARCYDLFEIGRSDHPASYAPLSPVTVKTDIALGRVLVAEDDGLVVGMISSVPTPDATMLYMLVVDREHRGRTLAPVLIRAAKKRWGKVMAFVVPHTLKSFEAAGMKMTGYVME